MAVRSAGRDRPAYITFTQQYDPQYWQGWDPALIASGDAAVIGAEAVRRYEAVGGECTGAWFISHDRDVQADGTIKQNHIHGIIQQSAGRRTEGKLYPTEIDAALGFATSIARAPGRGGRIENAHSYLIHAKDPDKTLYGVQEVATVRGPDYAEIEARHRDAWARRRVTGRSATVSAREWADLGDALVQKVLDGEVDELAILQDRTLTDIYTRNQAKVDLAFKVAAKRDQAAEVHRLLAGEFRKTILWIDGASQQGKTYLAQSFIEALTAATGWRVYRPAAKNAADAYRGEEVIWLNEPGSRAMEWPDLLTLLGPHEAGPLSARYANTTAVAPRVVVISVATDPVEFGFFVPGKRSSGDSLDQLLLRLSLWVHAAKVDDEPRYTVQRMVQGDTYFRQIAVPGRDDVEVLALTAAPVVALDGLDREEAVSVLVGEVAERSPEVRELPGVGEHLAALPAVAERSVDRHIEAAVTAQAEAHAAALADREAVAEVAAWYARRGLQDEATEVAARDRLPDLWGGDAPLPAVPAGLPDDNDPWPASVAHPGARFDPC